MKTSELKNIIEDNGYDFAENDGGGMIYIRLSNKNIDVAKVHKYSVGNYLLSSMPKVVSQAILDYAYTSIEDRKDKRFKLKFKELVGKNIYLCRGYFENSYHIGTGENVFEVNKIFDKNDVRSMLGNVLVEIDGKCYVEIVKEECSNG